MYLLNGKMEISEVTSNHLKNMCDAFGVLCIDLTHNRYLKPSMMHVTFQEHLNLIVQRYPSYWYIDKLWVNQKGCGIGTKCFKAFLEHSTKMVIWRTKKEKLCKWYIQFKGVRQFAKHNDYWYFIHTNDHNLTPNWCFEDLDIFCHPSYIDYTRPTVMVS